MSRRKKKNKFKAIWGVILLAVALVGTYFGFFGKGSGTLPGGSDITDGSIQVHMIDVGQADSILVRISDGDTVKNMLIDAGTSEGHKASIITDYLKKEGVTELEYFILTHPHADHIAGAIDVLEAVKVKNAVIPDCDYSTKTWANILEKLDSDNINVIFPEVGSSYGIGEAVMTVLAPSKTMLSDDDANNFSIVTRLVFGKTSFIFTGDAHTESEKEILKTFSADDLKCDVLKVGHHGSDTSTCDEFLSALSPSTALISVGEGNSYGHPKDVTVNKLNKAGVEILRTDKEGTVVLSSDGKEVTRLK